MMVDTALFVMSSGEAKEDSTFVCFTESRDREVCLIESIDRQLNYNLLLTCFNQAQWCFI